MSSNNNKNNALNNNRLSTLSFPLDTPLRDSPTPIPSIARITRSSSRFDPISLLLIKCDIFYAVEQ